MDRMPVGVRIAYYSISEVERAVTTATILSILAALDKGKSTFAADAFAFLYDFSNISAIILANRKSTNDEPILHKSS